ncbi:MAG: hypothetical protein BWK78_02140 [Thiotrichaceae bacterium IS1]|nr:MAG: hypothetical protein BWK78_02140 [Thiotrichaceae bacterium IS1]
MEFSKLKKEIEKVGVEGIVAHLIFMFVLTILGAVGAMWSENKIFFSLIALVFFALTVLTVWIWFTMRPFNEKKDILILGRESKINLLIGHVENRKSSIIIGIFNAERTAIVDYLRAESSKDRYGKLDRQLIFSYIDMSAQLPNFDYSKFWEQVLVTLYQIMSDDEKFVYNASEKADFNFSSLDKLAQHMKEKKQQLVIVIDRLHQIIRYDKLNVPEFFKTMRGLSAHSDAPINFILTIGGEKQLYSLNLSKQGELYEFNDMKRVILDSLSEDKLKELSKKGRLNLYEQIKEYGIAYPPLLIEVSDCLKQSKIGLNLIKRLKKSEIGGNCEEGVWKYLSTILRSSDYDYLYETMVLIAKNSVTSNGKILYDGKALDDLKAQGFIEKSNDQWQICSKLIAKFLYEEVHKTDQHVAMEK